MTQMGADAFTAGLRNLAAQFRWNLQTTSPSLLPQHCRIRLFTTREETSTSHHRFLWLISRSGLRPSEHFDTFPFYYQNSP